MTTSIENLLAICELSGGAVSPPAVLALVIALRRYATVLVAMADVIRSGDVSVSSADLNMISDLCEIARTVELPERPK